MNEAVIRSPKWLRNIADFEINTGEDIKGKPSKRMQKKIDEENRRQEEKRKQEEKERREKQDEKDKEDFSNIFEVVMSYISSNYKECEISIPKNNYLTVEKHDLTYRKQLDLEFKVTLDNTVDYPTFDVEIKLGHKNYNYKVSGLNYIRLKILFVKVIYEWYKSKDYKKSQSSYGKQGSYTPPSDSYKQSKPNESDEKKNKRRQYILLKDTLAGYIRQMDRIKEWKKQNPGKTHPDEETTNNEIKAVKNKINLLNQKFQFESHYYLKHINPIFS